VDPKNRPAPAPVALLALLRRRTRFLLRAREQHLECRAMAHFTVQADRALVAADYPQYRRQPQAPSRELRREERIENPPLGLLVDAAACIRHLQVDVAPRRQILV